MSEWMQCESRGPWIKNSLTHRINELRGAEKRCRKAYSQPFMGEPYTYLADAYEAAADVLQARLDAITVWNTRTPPPRPAQVEEAGCQWFMRVHMDVVSWKTSCEARVLIRDSDLCPGCGKPITEA